MSDKTQPITERHLLMIQAACKGMDVSEEIPSYHERSNLIHDVYDLVRGLAEGKRVMVPRNELEQMRHVLDTERVPPPAYLFDTVSRWLSDAREEEVTR